MLKRSFAEFHAQRSQPGRLAEVAAGEVMVEAYDSTPWPTCFRGCTEEQVDK